MKLQNINTKKRFCENFECSNLASYKIEFAKKSCYLCKNCLKEFNYELSRVTTPKAIKSKFQI